MNKKLAELIALQRHEIISPVLVEEHRSQMEYFKKIAELDFTVPGKGARRFSVSTMKTWLNKYKKYGFDGILPKNRKDVGKPRRLEAAEVETILSLRREKPDVSVVQFYKKCIEKEILGFPPLSIATLRIYLKKHGMVKRQIRTPRKRFEMNRFGELWTSDFSHTIQVLDGKRRRKAIVFAIIDDYSRVIVGSKFYYCETTIPIEHVFKEAILAHGLPDRFYCDNGPSFSSAYLRCVCAKLGIGLIHSKPYDSPSRGKIERYFRTLKESFMAIISDSDLITLDELNEKYSLWLRTDYHHALHRGIDERPIDRYQRSMAAYPTARVNPEIIDEFFMVEATRRVNKDATISYLGNIFEVPSIYIGETIVVKHTQENPLRLYIYKDDKRVHSIKLIDTKENGRIYRPKREDHISFTNLIEEKKQ